MTYRKNGLNLFGLCLLMMASLFALASTSAQAAGNWSIAGANIKSTAQIIGEKDEGTFGFLVPSLSMELVFENFSVDDGLLFTGGEGYMELLFTGGKLYVKGKLVAGCTPGDLIFKLKHSLILHGGKTYDLLQPAKAGDPLTVTTYPEESCGLPPKVNVTGSLILESVSGFEKEAVKHLVRQAPAALFPGDAMLFGLNAMSLDGSMNLSLTGANKGQTWSGLG